MPDHLTFLRSYFTRGPVNPLFPLAMVLSLLVLIALVGRALSPETGAAAQAGDLLLAALLALAILEHCFMLVRLPIDTLWRWSTRGRVQSGATTATLRPTSIGGSSRVSSVTSSVRSLQARNQSPAADRVGLMQHP